MLKALFSGKGMVLVTLVVGATLVFANIVFQWYETMRRREGAERQDLLQWSFTGDGSALIWESLASVGAGLVSAAAFLIGVQVLLEREREKRHREESQRTRANQFIQKLREDPGSAAAFLHELHAAGDLSGGALTGAFLADTDLRGYVLDGAKFQGANFRKADLTDASLVQVDLRNAVLIDAELSGATLVFANLTGARVSEAQLRLTSSLWQCTMPDGTIYEGAWDLPGDVELARQYGVDLTDPSQRALFYSPRVKESPPSPTND